MLPYFHIHIDVILRAIKINIAGLAQLTYLQDVILILLSNQWN